MKPLSDIIVLDMGTFITGPAAGMLLADLGATVIKIEEPENGDPFRAFKGGLYSPHFQTYNRNKQSIRLNTKLDADRAELDRLVAGADVFLQNFRPGVAERLGADATRLRAINSRLIYCSISGFGKDGPLRDQPAFDTVAQAASGFLRLLLNPANPRVVGPAIGDALTGFYAAYGILGALHQRGRTGNGCLVETSMLEAMCHFNLDDFTHYFSASQDMGPYSRPHVSQSYVFQCSDDGWIALHMSSPTKFWQNLSVAVGHPEMLERAEFADRDARIAHYEQVVAYLAPFFLAHPRDWWTRRLTELEVPHSPVLSAQEVTESAQAKHLGLVVEAEGPEGRFRTIRSPVSFDGVAMTTVTPPPTLGQDDDAVLGRGAAAAIAGLPGAEAKSSFDMSTPILRGEEKMSQLPKGLHHNAYVSKDLEATRKFYEDVIGMPLIATYCEKDVLFGAERTYCHCFFGMADGGALAFFQFADPADQALFGPELPQSPFHHIALTVDGPTQAAIEARIAGHGFAEPDSYVLDHGYCRSVYIKDPNGLTLEFTVDDPVALTKDSERRESAREDLRRWLAGDHHSNNVYRTDAD